jgi:(p)ppGpp synthase/HD superfamily hydrolase
MEEYMAAYSERYDTALILAVRAHREQVRKIDDVPYIVHPVHVSVILIRHGFAEDVAIAGLLHDVVEDQDVALAHIEATFGPAVAEMVNALTERKWEGNIKRSWEIRKQEALDQIRRASLGAVAVKAADTLHSARSLIAGLERQTPSLWSNFARGPEQSLWYHQSVAAIVRERLGSHPLADELEATVKELAQAIVEAEAS